jgi:drug/metabolite transporter (DMT)-like permease
VTAGEAAATPYQEASTGQVWTGLVTVYLVWGSTYLGIAILIETLPPLLGSGSRLLLAAVVLGAILTVRRGPKALALSRRELASAALIGFLLLGMGIGGVTLSEATIPSGLAALVVASMPLWVVVFRRLSGQRPHRSTVLGVGLGLVGLIVLVLPGGWTGGTELRSVGIVLLGTFCWAYGSFLSPSLPLPRDAFVLTVWEMASGAAVLMIAGLARGETIDWSTVSGRSMVAWLYLGLVGSLVGFTAFVWSVGHAPLSLVSTYAYVNPVVAVVLGALVLSEPVTGWTLLGGAIVVVGVVLVMRGERLAPPSEVALPPDDPSGG